MNDLVSVVVCCYNHEDYIEECLESIFNQSYQNIELLVFNDGSTDDSGSLIENALKKSPFSSQYFYHENQGVVKTRNLALDRINGKFLVFVDSDDIIEREYIKNLVDVAVESSADIVYSSMIDMKTGEVVLSAKEFDLKELLIGNYIHASSLVRTSIIKDKKFDDALNREKLEDYDFFLNLIVRGGAKAVPCYTTGLTYRVSENSRSNHQNLKSYYHTYAYILSKYLPYFSNDNAIVEILRFHFDDLTNLDIEHSIKEEQISVYLYRDGAYNEKADYLIPVKFLDSFVIPVEKGVTKLKIHPSNIPSFYEEFSVVSKKYKTELLPSLSNAIIDGNSFVFEHFYPFIEYTFDFEEDDNLLVSYKRYNINDITSDNYIGKILAMKSYQYFHQLEEVERQNILLKKAFSKIENDYNELNQQYHTIIGSRRWTIPTKIINFFRRK
ncbi:Glycosyl transferase family 2 [Streptococcus henryi]|uniref:Glycosyl transferase family 2 n=1 Tax=Streptococcus henryi TaxID=439219 RepID=A0A1G6C6X8_9STRE|nr:glycosyltransferase family A protein [Streptococcus henryi]SDB28639.1 Glycosyl transferase family 2 [Streptococcus henryi]